MKSIFRKIVVIAITILAILIVLKWDLIRYGFQQAKGQISIMYDAAPLDLYLNDPKFPDSLKSKIKLVQAVKSFAAKDLGFSSQGQYQKMYDQKGKELMWVVTAAYPYKLESYEWKFPILGKVAYKGFFIEEEANKLAEEQKRKGLDVRLRTASAWSTLGWLNDPLLSNVLQYDEGRLAELILHELIHDEIFIKDSIDFNENLASFFGQEFTKIFFTKLQNQNKVAYTSYLMQLEDRHLLNEFISGYLPKFDSLYQQIQGLSTIEKENRKNRLIQLFKLDLKSQKFRNRKYTDFVNSDIIVNNAYLLSYKRYNGHQKLLEKVLIEDFSGNVLEMLRYYQNNFNSL